MFNIVTVSSNLPASHLFPTPVALLSCSKTCRTAHSRVAQETHHDETDTFPSTSLQLQLGPWSRRKRRGDGEASRKKTKALADRREERLEGEEEGQGVQTY